MEIMVLALLLLGIVGGLVVGQLLGQRNAQSKLENEWKTKEEQMVHRSAYEQLQKRYDELESRSVSKQLYQELQEKQDALHAQLQEKEGELSGEVKNRLNLQEKLDQQKSELEELQAKFQKEFENLSNKILDEKSQKFIKMNEEKVSQLLDPLRERIKSFEEKVDKSNKDQLQYGAALKEQLRHIAETSKKMSDDTLRLTRALKGDKKMQGDWGEMQLERLLQSVGLEEGTHYEAQTSFENEGGRRQRLDYLIHLPDDKHLVLDAKVSLVDYERALNDELSEADRELALKAHVRSIRNHIDELGSRNYQQLEGLHSPDYVLMFVPIEPALYLALREDAGLFERALDKNVVLVSTSTLLATLRTVSYIWKQEFQNRNVREIARESGALYDKFVGFMEDLISVGKKIDDAKKEYGGAMNKLFESSRKGDTIVGRIERIKKLGADANKQLPKNIIDRIDE